MPTIKAAAWESCFTNAGWAVRHRNRSHLGSELCHGLHCRSPTDSLRTRSGGGGGNRAKPLPLKLGVENPLLNHRDSSMDEPLMSEENGPEGGCDLPEVPQHLSA